MEYYMYKGDDELMHWGIKGMKWGVRRFQNKDGSLTPAGEKRRARLESKLEKLGGKKKTADNDGDAAKPTRKRASDMSDDELDKAITRARKEDEYNRLRPEPAPIDKHSLMKKLVREAVVPAAVNSGKRFLENAMDTLGKKVLGGKVDPNSLEALKKTFEKLDYAQKIDKLRNPDKYTSEEDLAKRQKREQDKANWDAQQEGYKDAAAKAQAKRDADAAARAANESRSNEYYNRFYNMKGSGEKVTNTSSASGTSSGTLLLNAPITSISKSTVSTGKSRVDSYVDVLDRNGNVLASFDRDGERK